MTSPREPSVGPPEGDSRSKKPLIIGAVVLVVVAAVAAALFWFLGDDAPERVSLEDAVAQVSTTEPADGGGGAATGGGSASTGGGAAADGIEGTWSVDNETGDFDYEEATGSFVGFRIQEELAGIGATEAVGRTGGVAGSITIDGTTVTEGSFEVDMTSITTNERRRDDRVQSALSTDRFPTATFTITEPIELGAGAADGETVSATAIGDLTIKGITNQIQMPIEAKLVEGTVVVVGSVDITFADWDVEVPRAPVVLGVEDHGDLELQLLLVRG